MTLALARYCSPPPRIEVAPACEVAHEALDFQIVLKPAAVDWATGTELTTTVTMFIPLVWW